MSETNVNTITNPVVKSVTNTSTNTFDPTLGDVFLKLIKENEKFKAEYEVFAPEVFADIQSFVTNPNCSCKNKIKNFVVGNNQKHEAFLNEFTENNKETLGTLDIKKMKTEIHEEMRQRMLTNMRGQVFKIKKSDWVNFPAEMAKQKVFIRSFSVVPIDEENIEVYILG
jgi:hypothetical protein